MSDKELIKISIEEFSRIQRWMILVKDKDSDTYQAIYERYVDLKAILAGLGTNVAELDRVKA